MTALLAMTRRVFLAGAAALPLARPRKHRVYDFTVAVTDAAGATATRQLSIKVMR